MNEHTITGAPLQDELAHLLASDTEPVSPPSLAAIPQHITAEELFIRIQQFLDYYRSRESMPDLSMLDGLFAALACSPAPVAASVWMAEIWGGTFPAWSNKQSARIFAELVLRFQKGVEQHLQNDTVFKPLFLVYGEDETRFEVVDYWCEGFMLGAGVGMRPLRNLPRVMELMEPIALFAQGDGLVKSIEMPEEESELYKRQIAPSVRAIWTLSHSRADFGSTTLMSTEEKVGRNDPCPCGSGKKFKKCCLK